MSEGLRYERCLPRTGRLLPFSCKPLRLLIASHVAGFEYGFFNKKLNDYYGPTGLDEFSGIQEEHLRLPLVNQPGD
jgi:hypothetical protein